ncbi:MAG: hypothetical protein E7089_09665 [Bacteroidales bacterium]|nr:hypothetical protein [Bacteroidales bacterium]
MKQASYFSLACDYICDKNIKTYTNIKKVIFIILFSVVTLASFAQNDSLYVDGKSEKCIIIGTHNSATSGKTVWWQRPFAWLLHMVSRCQNKTIEQQLEGGVRLFNLQVCRYKGEWHISHGLCIYKEKLFDVLDQMKLYKGIVFQLYLDRNFFVGQDEEEFMKLVAEVKNKYCSPEFIMQKAWIEGTDKYPHKTEYNLSIEEHYWSKSWAETFGNSWMDKLPLLKRHAKRFNDTYKGECKADYLMLDFYE